MSELPDQSRAQQRTAGSLLREARQAQGLHIAALAATIKVAQRKLEALEADRFDELPDATFTRALAQTVCRALKIDAAPVLALLPLPRSPRLEQVALGLNEPFLGKLGRGEAADWMGLVSPGMWGALLLGILALVIYLLPQDWLLSAQQALQTPLARTSESPSVTGMTSKAQVAPVEGEIVAGSPAQTGSGPGNAQSHAAPLAGMPAATLASAPDSSPAAPAAASAAAVTAEPALKLRAQRDSWMEVREAGSRVLLSRIVRAGESVSLEGALPLQLTIDNAGAAEVVFRGQMVDLTPSTRDNVAKLELR